MKPSISNEEIFGWINAVIRAEVRKWTIERFKIDMLEISKWTLKRHRALKYENNTDEHRNGPMACASVQGVRQSQPRSEGHKILSLTFYMLNLIIHTHTDTQPP